MILQEATKKLSLRSSTPVPVPYANLSNPQTLNLYAMVSDDPESFADLDGHKWNVPGGEGSQGCIGNDQQACKGKKAEKEKRKSDSLKSKALKAVAEHPKTVKAVFITLQVVTALSGILDDGASEFALPEEAAAEEGLEAAAEKAAGKEAEEAAEAEAASAEPQSEPGTAKDQSLQGRQDQLKDMQREQKDFRSGKRKGPIESIKKTEQNMDHANRRITSLDDAEN